MIIDISSIKKPTLHIKLREGFEIHVLPPPKRLLNGLIGLGDKNGDENKKKTIENLYKEMAEILSYNEEKIAVTDEDMEELDIFQVNYLAEKYTNFVLNSSRDPN